MNNTILQHIIYSSKFIIPEIMLTCGIIGLILLNIISKAKKHCPYTIITVVTLITALITTIPMLFMPEHSIYFNMLLIDKFSIFFRILFIISSIFLTLISINTKELENNNLLEYYVLIISMLIGMNLLASANNLLMIYLSLEMISIPSYILTGYLKNKRFSLEASLKYIIYGAMSSAIMLYSFTYIYGFTNTLTLNEIKQAILSSNIPSQFLLFFIILTMVGIGFKLSLVPFHFWTPDVYQGAPTPISAHLSIASKAAAFALLLRIFLSSLATPSLNNIITIGAPWINLIAILSVITMTLGNVIALVQKDIKRLLAYSTIAHAGYMIMGLVALNNDGVSAILFYLIAYLIMNLGSFYTAILLYPSVGSYNIGDYKGLWNRNSAATIAMAFFMLSLVGIPPFIGFFAKFILFAAIINAGWFWLAVVAVINSVVSLYYYVYIIKVMVIDTAQQTKPILIPKIAYSLVIILAILNLIFGPAFKPFQQFAKNSTSICNVNSYCIQK